MNEKKVTIKNGMTTLININGFHWFIFVGFLDNADRTHEIVVFTNTAQEAESLGEVLRTNNHFVLVAHEFLNPQALADIRRQWYTPHTVDLMPILGKKLVFSEVSWVLPGICSPE